MLLNSPKIFHYKIFPHNCNLRDWNGTLIKDVKKILDQVNRQDFYCQLSTFEKTDCIFFKENKE